MLCKAWRTLAGESSDGVDTQELTVMLLGRTLIQVFAGLSIWLQAVSSGAGAQITALCIFTQEVTGLRRQSAFIHVDTRARSEVGFVAHVTVAPEGADGVDALTVLAQIWHHQTLVDISSIGGVARSKWTHLFVLDGPRQWTELTLCPPPSACVAAALRFGHTVPVCGRLLAHGLQNLHVTVALSIVNTLGSSGAGLKAVVAFAAVTPHCVDTTPVLTDARFGTTLVQIHTSLSIWSALHTRWADTHEGTNQVLAGHALRVTVIQTFCTLILVSAHALIIS